ncbi:MAG: acyltransferase family protein [Verrucomicrobiota bacterium]
MATFPPSLPDERRHDYDALRGFAMLLGIVLHACMAYMGPYWVVQDRSESSLMTAAWAFIHGWRMELFFVLAGYFTAMVLRREGAIGMVKRRLRRLLIPFALAAVAFLPLNHWVSSVGLEQKWRRSLGTAQLTDGVYAAVRQGDLAALQKIAPDDSDLGNAQYLAAALGQTEALQVLLKRNNGRPAETMLARLQGENALHAAARFGQTEAAQVIVESVRGHTWANEVLQAKNDNGQSPAQLTTRDENASWQIYGQLGLKHTEEQMKQGRGEVLALLEPGQKLGQGWNRLTTALHRPWLSHLWFMWVLTILTLAFGAWAWVNERWNLPAMPRWMLAEWTRLIWLLPVTTLLFWWARKDFGFGVDGEMSILEKPATLVFYGFFFAFGAAMRIRGCEPARYPWLAWIQLPLLTFGVLPLAFFSAWSSEPPIHFLSCGLQACVAWGMTFTLLDLFTTYFSKPIKAVRTLADASLWIYVAHLPLVIALQLWMVNWKLWPIVKCGLVCSLTFGSLLLINHFLIRRTWVGLLLNGKRAAADDDKDRAKVET